MKFSVSRDVLLKCLATVSPAVISGSSSMAILKTIYMEAQEDKIIIRATNLTMYIETWVKADVETSGACCIDFSLSQIINALSNDVIFFEKQKSLKISQGNSVYKLPYMQAEEYPIFPEIKEYHTLTSIQPLCDALHRCGIAVATDSFKPVLQTFLFNTEDNYIAAADGVRLSVVNDIEMEGIVTIIPNQPIKSILNLLKSTTEEIDLSISEWFAVKSENWKIAINSLAGAFPDINSVINNIDIKNPITTIKVSKDLLINKLKIASLFSKRAYDDSRPYQMNMSMKNKNLTLSMTIESIVDFRELLECEVVGKEFSVLVGPKLLLEAVMEVKAAIVELSFYGKDKPFTVSDLDNKNWIYIQMPMAEYSKEKIEEKDDF